MKKFKIALSRLVEETCEIYVEAKSKKDLIELLWVEAFDAEIDEAKWEFCCVHSYAEATHIDGEPL